MASPDLRAAEQEHSLRSLLAETRTRLEARPHLLDGLAVLLVVGGAALRIYRSTALSLWLDEGFTVLFARLPWDSVLGLHGAYDVHPPLYYAAVKAVSLLLPEVVAARYLSVFAGTATLVVLYLLVVRIAGRPAALVACLVAALSPLAVWYSQEARQYALTGLAVSITYLALVSFQINPRRLWALLYGLALAAAAYLDYSALYAVVPQVLILPFVLHRHRRRATPIFIAGASAVAAYLPWLPQVFRAMHDLGASRAGYLGTSLDSVGGSLLSIAGLAGQGTGAFGRYFYSPVPSPWERWSNLDLLMATLAITAACLGAVALARQRLGLLVACSLSLGTVVVGVVASQVSPGFAPRTVSYAVLGWAVLLGAAAGGRRVSIPRRTAALVTVAAMIAASTASLQAQYEGDKEHWRDWAKAVSEAARFGFPMVIFPTIAPTLLDTYEQGSVTGRRLDLADAPDLRALDSFAAGQPALWVASYDIAASTEIDQLLQEQGMRPVVREQFVVLLSLDLYVRPGSGAGRPLQVNGDFAGSADEAIGWHLTPTSASLRQGISGRELTLSSGGGQETSAVLLLPGTPHHLYVLTFDARSHLTTGAMRAFLICVSRNEMLQVAPDGSGAGVPEGGGWQTVGVGVVCPPDTDQIRIDLRNGGIGDLDLRGVHLYEVVPDQQRGAGTP